jgi:membrane protein
VPTLRRGVPVAHAASPERAWDASRGREARRPRDIPAPGWRDILWRVKERISADNLSIISAGVAFYALLAIFPALIALVGLYGMVFDPQQVAQHLSALTAVLPGDAAELIGKQLGEVTSMERTSLGVGSIAAVLLALWSASAGMRTLMTALDVAYSEKETRGTVKFYATSLLLTLGAVLGAMIAIATIVAVPVALNFLGLGERLENIVAYGRWPLLAVVMLAGLAIVYRYGPDRSKPQWRWVSWGAVVATLLWIGGSALFSLYVTRFGDYNKTYGSMGAVVILMTWFLLTAYIFLIGGEINAEMERQTRADTTDRGEKPLGRRGAQAADTVGRTP